MRVLCKLCANLSLDESGREVKEVFRFQAGWGSLQLSVWLPFPHFAFVLPESHLVGS